MSSKIGWIDFSPKDRNRIKRFMDIMGMGGIVDELGISVIRDALSNKIFPGFSTLYTRAKYFLITPYIIADWKFNKKGKISGAEYFHKTEIDINLKIKEFYTQGQNNESYFGKEKSDGQLKRQPSEIYWNGITFLHLLNTDSSLLQVLSEKSSSFDETLSYPTENEITTEDGNPQKCPLINIPLDYQWSSKISNIGLNLTRAEAELLRDRIIQFSPNGLPAALLLDPELWEEYKNAQSGYANSGKEFTNPFTFFVSNCIGNIKNQKLRRNLSLGHDLAIFLHGAHIAYNIQIRKKAGIDSTKYSEMGKRWMSGLKETMLDYDSFNTSDYIEKTTLKHSTRDFLNNAHSLIFSKKNWNDIESQLCELTENQEKWNKKSKSRFVKLDKGQVIDDVNKGGWLGLTLINYRYHSTLNVVRDIYNGLNQVEENGN